jgi:5'-methylthioadenosine phosphorylase
MIAIIGGTSLLDAASFAGWPDVAISTRFGAAQLKRSKNTVFLQRHGAPCLPPHRINHKANIAALKELGAQKVLAINSVGSLKAAIKPGTLVIPDDFICPWHIETFFDDEARFMVPAMDEMFARDIFGICTMHTRSVRMGGTYVQTIGPRLETRAEVKMLKRFGDIVGMTLASEATLAMELELPYASICSVDNYCNGILKTPLTMDEIFANIAKNARIIENILNAFIDRNAA